MAIRKINSRAIADGAVATADLDDNPLTIDSLVVDTSTLVVDAANNRVGINTSSPASKLHVNGSFRQTGATAPFEWTVNPGATDYYKLNSVGYSDNIIVATAAGNVGFGQTTPQAPIDAARNAADWVARFQNTNAAAPYNVQIYDAPSSAAGYPLLQVTNSAGTGTYFRVDSSTGAIYTPKMTYFAAKGPASWQTISNGSNTKVNLTTEIIDRAATYDASTSRFTATVPGYYRFEFHQYARLQGSQGDNSSHWYGGFLINGSVDSTGATQHIVGYQNDGDYDNFGIHTGIFNLSAGDYVEVYGRAGSVSNAEVYGYWSMFTGIQLEK